MKKRIFTLAAAAVMLVSLLSGCATTFTPQEARSGVVRVLTFYERSVYLFDLESQRAGELVAEGTVIGSGSAFGVGAAGEETDIFVTNRHAVEEESYTLGTIEGVPVVYEDIRIGTYILLGDYSYSGSTGLDTSRSVPCEVLYEAGTDEADLAVLRAAEVVEGRMALPLLSLDTPLEADDDVRALGYPSSTDEATLDASGNMDYAGSVDKVTVTDGIVSLHTTYVDSNDTQVNVIQHTATVNHGNSGGPLITLDGAVAGVNTWGYGQDTSSGDQQAFAAVEIGYVMDVLDDLRIEYDAVTAGGGVSAAMVAVIAAVVVAILVVAVVLSRRKKRAPAPAAPVAPPPPAPAPAPAPAAQPVMAGDSGLRIQAQSGAFAGRRFSINGQVRIGRDPSRNDLVYPADTQGISGVHCVVRVENGQLYLVDLGSTYGTFLSGGSRLAANQPVRLEMGERFCLGSEKEQFIVTGKGGV